MNQLIEGVLPVRAWFAPDDRARRVRRDAPAVPVDALAVALHLELLKKRREELEVLVVGQDRVRLRPEEQAVPGAEEAHESGDVPVERRRPEVVVRLARALEELRERVEPDDEGDREPDRGPERIP